MMRIGHVNIQFCWAVFLQCSNELKSHRILEVKQGQRSSAKSAVSPQIQRKGPNEKSTESKAIRHVDILGADWRNKTSNNLGSAQARYQGLPLGITHTDSESVVKSSQTEFVS